MSTKHTAGPWHWVDPENDDPWDGESYLVQASLRTVEEFGENKVDVIDGKHYTRFALPKFILHYVESIDPDSPEGEGSANARLIAAAPELLEALIKLSESYTRLTPTGYPDSDAQKQAKAAIAKATGEA